MTSRGSNRHILLLTPAALPRTKASPGGRGRFITSGPPPRSRPPTRRATSTPRASDMRNRSSFPTERAPRTSRGPSTIRGETTNRTPVCFHDDRDESHERGEVTISAGVGRRVLSGPDLYRLGQGRTRKWPTLDGNVDPHRYRLRRERYPNLLRDGSPRVFTTGRKRIGRRERRLPDGFRNQRLLGRPGHPVPGNDHLVAVPGRFGHRARSRAGRLRSVDASSGRGDPPGYSYPLAVKASLRSRDGGPPGVKAKRFVYELVESCAFRASQ